VETTKQQTRLRMVG